MACGLGLSVLSVPASTFARPDARAGFRLERMALAPTPEDGFALTLPDTLAPMRWASALSLGYALNPFELRGPPAQAVVTQRLGAELAFALGLVEGLEAYARVPFVLVSAGENTRIEQASFGAPGGFAIGDIALGGTAHAFQFRSLHLGARAEMLLPTGSPAELTGDYAIAPRGHLLASYELSRLTFGLEGGAVYRPHRDFAQVRIGSEYEGVAGSRLKLRQNFELWFEAFGTRSARRPNDASALDTLDLLLGGRHRAPVGAFCLHTSGALGAGFSDAAGDPDLRVLFSVALTSEKHAETLRASAHDAFSAQAQAAR